MWNKNAAISHLNSNAKAKSLGRCAEHVRKAIALVLLIVGQLSPISPAHGESRLGQPDARAWEFYQWYLDSLAANRDPMHDSPSKFSSYVSRKLIRQIDRQTQSEDGLGEDYFLTAQGYLDDWKSNINVGKAKIRASQAELPISLGATPETSHRLTVTMVREDGAWKIRQVRHR